MNYKDFFKSLYICSNITGGCAVCNKLNVKTYCDITITLKVIELKNTARAFIYTSIRLLGK